MYVDRDLEFEAIEYVCAQIKSEYPLIHPDNTIIFNVSPDYSSTAALHLSHYLSKGGDYVNFINVNVPYPDEDPFQYQTDFKRLFSHLPEFDWYIFIEAGIISGGNYTFLTSHVTSMGVPKEKLITATLFENLNSKFKCNVVGNYYDWDKRQLEFYWERENRHWD